MVVEGGDWRTFLDALRDGVIVADADDRILYLNPAACRLLACDPEAMAGQPLSRTVPERVRTVEGLSFHRHLGSRGDAQDEPQRAPACREDGVEIEVEYSVSETPPLADGRRLLVVILRRLHEGVAFTTERVGLPKSGADRSYELVFEHAPVGIFHFDSRGVITACNDRFVQVIGSSKRLLVGLDMTTLPDAKLVECVRSAIDGQHAYYDGDYRSATADKVTPVFVHFAPILEQDGSVHGGVGIVEDVTERRQTEQALARAERMASLGTLAAGVAHEINNPLTYVMTSVDVARMRLSDLRGDGGDPIWSEVDTALGNAQEGADRVRMIVRDLKTFVRSDDEPLRSIDVIEVIESAIKLAWNEIRHRARLVRSYEPVPAVWGNAAKLVQVFVNLLANAAQAIPEGDVSSHRIEVRTRADDDRVVVEIEDTGVGIPPGDVERIFEPFWSDRPVGSGTGLGLSIVHGIVTSLGGAIDVDSAVGRGSLFRVFLPKCEGPVATPPPPDVPHPQRHGRARILIIDDEARLAQTIRLALKPVHDVEACTSGREAIELLSADPNFDLVLCDLMLPDVTGPDVYEALRDRQPDVLRRFVFMTGGAFTQRSREFLRSVPNPRLEKPFHVDQIDTLLARLR